MSRRSLFARLDAGMEHRLTLVSAPAGFGKTTLISAWLQQRERQGWKVTWLSLDQNDNDPCRFWAYVIAALQTIEPGFGEDLQAALFASAPSEIGLPTITNALINAVSGLDQKILLVLDDYHVIQSDAVHAILNDLLDHLTPNLCLIIATREDPPLALARRRARGELTELRAVDLRFSFSETMELFNACLGLELSAEDTQVLYRRTDGWVVGLHLAGISLQDRTLSERKAFVSAFAGDDQFIFDYLMDEVFRHLDARQQDFLLHTSILERLCGPLCCELTGFMDSGSLLEQLERANLFLQPLDNRRQWYRYHPLFADLLRRRLDETAGKAKIQQLYRLASAWHEREGLLAEAVSYAAPDPEFAAALIERHVLDTFYRSEIYQVHQWLKTLPETVLYAHPLLCAVYANTHVLVHFTPESYAQASRLLQVAESGGPLAEETVAYIAKFRAYLARFQGQPPAEVIRLAQLAIGLIPAGSMRFRSALAFLKGVAYQDTGDEPAAEAAFADALYAGMASGDWFNAMAAVDRQVYLLTRRGRLRAAAALCWDVLDRLALLQSKGETPPPITGTVHIRLGGLLMEWNELDEAELHLRRGVDLLERTALPDGLAGGYLALACLCAARQNAQGALEAIQKVERLAALKDQIMPYCVRTWLALPHPDAQVTAALERWAMGQRLNMTCAGVYDLAQINLARWLVSQMQATRATPAQDHPDQAVVEAYLAAQIAAARRTGWEGWEIEGLVLQALAHQARKQPLPAREALERALALGEPEGYLRLYADFGAAMIPLLQPLAKRDGPGSYPDRLLAMVKNENDRQTQPQASGPGKPAGSGKPPGSGRVTEALSARELEVLRLLADGLTNRQIAERLHLSPNTVRIHASTIYGKLGVNSRTQAAARARALDLL